MQDELNILKRQVTRERAARKEAEGLLEAKSLALFQANENLIKLNEDLEAQVAKRTAELQLSQLQFRQLVETADDIIYRTNAAGFFTYANPIAQKLLGYSIESESIPHFTSLVREDYRAKVVKFYAQQIDKKQTKSYLEFAAVNKEGESIYVGQNVQILFDEEAKFSGVIAIARDITELYRARRALTNSEEKYRGIIESMELGLLEVDNDGLVIKAYDWFCDMCGYSADELNGKNAAELLLSKEAQQKMQDQAAKRSQGQAGVYEIDILKKDGTPLPVAISGSPFYNAQGEIEGSIGVHLDLSPQKELQQKLERARQAETEFLANMSHEIRTPLNAIIGLTHLMDDTNMNATQAEYAQNIKYSANLLQSLISDVLDISKIEAGELEQNVTDFSIEELLQTLARTLNYRAEERGNALQVSIDSSLPAFIKADRTWLNQILMNLVGNAIKFTENGVISIKATVHTEVGSTKLHCEVIDTGIGMEPHQLEKIFDQFKQADKATRQRFGGTGLGLAISKNLVELHGGQLSVVSEKDAGTTFKFHINIEIATDSIQAITQTNHNTKLNVKSVLVVEDNALNRKYLTTLLAQWDIDFDAAENGKKALPLLQEKSYDLILMDMQMPEMNGYETAQWIRSNSNPNQHTPIIALTASALLDEKKRALDSGMNDHLTKPFLPEQLKKAMGKISGAQNAVTTSIFSNLPLMLNQQALDSFYGNDREYAQMMFQTFLDLFDAQTQNLIDDLKTKDATTVARTLHKLKPGYDMVGLKSIADAFGQLEMEIKSGNWSDEIVVQIENWIEKVKEGKQQVESVYKQLTD